MTELLDRIIFGNSVYNYFLCGLIILLALLLKHLFAGLLCGLLFKFFKKFAGADAAGEFRRLLFRPVELLFFICMTYIAINQLDYPLERPLFDRSGGRARLASHVPVANELVGEPEKLLKTIAGEQVYTYGNLLDKVFLLAVLSMVFVLMLRLIDFIALVLEQRARAEDSRSALQIIPFTRELVKILVGSFGLLIILSAVFKFNIGLVISGLGIGGLALALAGKETIENLFGAFTIFIDKPFVQGDMISVNGITAVVENVGFRSTRLRTLEKSLLTIPNKSLVDNPVDNLSMKTLRRVAYTLGLDMDASSAQVQLIIAEIQAYFINLPELTNDSFIALDGIGESSLDLQVIYWVEMGPYPDFVRLKEQITFHIINTIYKHHAGTAFPTRKMIHASSSSSASSEEAPLEVK